MLNTKLARLFIHHCLSDIKNRHYRAFPDICTLIQSSLHRPYAPRELLHSAINRRLIYIRIYKSASTTIYDWIQPSQIHPLENYFQQIARILLFRRKWGNTDKILAAHFQKSETPFLFSFVRNPFIRHVSCYKDRVLRYQESKQHSTNKLPTKNKLLLCNIYPILPLLSSFEVFTLAVASTPDYYANEHIKSQYATLYENGNLLPDYVGKVENFNHDARYLCEQFNLPSPKKLNASLPYDYRAFYTLETVELVAKRYASDIQAFGYEGELKALRQYIAKGYSKDK